MAPRSQEPPDNKQAPALDPVDRKDLSSGLITLGAVSEQNLPETAVRESLNFNFDPIGAAQLRKGITRLGNALPGTILGLYQYVDTVNLSAPHSQFLAVSGTACYYLNGNSFTAIRSSLTNGQKARFTTFLNQVFMVNGADQTAWWDGAAGSFSTTGNAASAPVGSFVENFKLRVYIWNANSRLYYSSVASVTQTPGIVWNTDPNTGQWVDVSPQDGDFPTAMQRFRTTMLLFKTNHIYRLFDVGSADTDPYIGVGTSSQESVIETKQGVYFHHQTGFFQYNIYGVVQEISRPIWDIILAIPSSSYSSVAGWLEADGDHISWSVGNVTVRGTAYTNLVVRYTISTETWTHYSYPTQFVTAIRRMPYYNDGTTLWATAGDSSGNVYLMNNGLTDDGKPISYSLVHRWDYLDDLLSTRKNVMIANFCHVGGAGSNVSYQTEDQDPDALNDWSKHRIGQLKTINTGFNTVNAKGRKIRFRIWGQSSGPQFLYNGYEIIGATNEFITFQ